MTNTLKRWYTFNCLNQLTAWCSKTCRSLACSEIFMRIWNKIRRRQSVPPTPERKHLKNNMVLYWLQSETMSSIHFLNCLSTSGLRQLKAYPSCLWWEQGYTLDRMPDLCRVNAWSLWKSGISEQLRGFIFYVALHALKLTKLCFRDWSWLLS